MSDSTYTIGYFVGSLASDSINRRLSEALIRLAPHHLTFREIPIDTVPLYSRDYDASYPPEALELKELVESVDGILFVTPEYNRDIPGALKNAIDWGSRPWMRNSWEGKPAATLGASIGSIGTYGAQSHLKAVLSFLDMAVMNHPDFYFNITRGLDENGGLTPSARALVREFLASFHTFVRERGAV